MTAITKDLILKITSVFENSTPELQYNYIEALGDGRGYTFGYCGFTTGTGDGLDVIALLCARTCARESFSKYIPRLKELAENEDGSIDGLEGFEEAWKTTGGTPAAVAAQHEVGDRLYWIPAINYFEAIRWKTALGLACLYDAIIQHGGGEDHDSLGAMILRCQSRPQFSHAEERKQIAVFLGERMRVLEHAHDPETREEWANSTPRVEALENILVDGNLALTPPIAIRSRDFNATIT